MNELTVIVDGNYLAHKCKGIAKGFDKDKYDENNKYLSKESEVNELVAKMVTDLSYSLNYFPGPKRVILTKDSSSWRKKIEIPEHAAYKSSRKYKDDTDWEKFHTAIDEFIKLVSENGILVSIIDSAEGDDLIYLWSEYINSDEISDNVVIFTGDGDLSQVVKYNDSVYTVVYDTKQSKNKIIAKNGFDKWINKKNNTIIDIFNDGVLNKLLNNDGIDILKRVMLATPIDEIDPNEVVLNKIFCGDDGDTVPAIFQWGNIKENGKYEKRVTNKHYIKIHEHILENYNEIDIEQLLHNNTFKNKIRLILQETTKVNIPIDKFKEKLKLNSTLIYLKRDILPESIVTEFDKTKKQMYSDAKPIQLNRNILVGTKYEVKKKEIVSDIFNMYK